MARALGDPDRIQNSARALASRLRTPAIVIARQGTDGSSGWAALRRTRWEAEITSLALDAIKARHGVEKLHIVGQSGGGHLVGALAAIADDVACAVAGSAPLAINPESFYRSEKIPAPQRFYNPVDQAATIAKKPGLRLMLVTEAGTSGCSLTGRRNSSARSQIRRKDSPVFCQRRRRAQPGVTAYRSRPRACIAGKS